MKIYIDTEFIEAPNHLELISIGMVKPTGDTYYAISSEFDPNRASDWVKENVIQLLETDIERKTVAVIKEDIVAFIGYMIPQFWAYFASFDWVLIQWMYGGMSKLPYNFPMYCRDLKQEIDRLQFPPEYFPENKNKHHALSDAHWNRALHLKLMEYERKAGTGM
ncbi:MAG: 3'-5' exoribonuclease [Microscillaceae bacterium]|nr:3'-5' exoribonuclease [Microscillaceae bacterium]